MPGLIKFNEPFETMLQIYETTYLKEFNIASNSNYSKILQILLILYFNQTDPNGPFIDRCRVMCTNGHFSFYEASTHF